MLLIILGVVIVVVTIVRSVKTEIEFKDILRHSIVHGLILSLGVLILSLGIAQPMHGYNEPVVVQEIELVEIIENSNVYIMEDYNNRLFFEYVSNSNNTKIIDSFDEKDLEIVISDKYEKPTLVKYHIEAKRGILSLGLSGDITDYKIYTLEENIKRFE